MRVRRTERESFGREVLMERFMTPLRGLMPGRYLARSSSHPSHVASDVFPCEGLSDSDDGWRATAGIEYPPGEPSMMIQTLNQGLGVPFGWSPC